MHIPKSAGTSVRVSLEDAFPRGAVGPKRQDATLLCGFTALDRLSPATRALLAVEPDEISMLADHAVVAGHFSMSTLLQVASPTSIATVLREPRARLLSHFAYWRLSSGLRSMWRGYAPLDHALRPLDQFLAEPQVAQATDNLFCRMLLSGDPRIPDTDFITDAEPIASDAIGVLQTLGFVGIVELQAPMWQGLSAFFDTPLKPRFINTTSDESILSSGAALELDITARTLDLISARTAADVLVYEHVTRQAGLPSFSAEQVATTAFANELVRLGNVAGPVPTESRARARKIEELSQQLDIEARRHEGTLTQIEGELHHTQLELQQARDELSRNHAWLHHLQTSLSWRVTAPARAAKRALMQRWERRPRARLGRRSDR
jgi:hypothetical protein